jgi:hypothetical protein
VRVGGVKGTRRFGTVFAAEHRAKGRGEVVHRAHGETPFDVGCSMFPLPRPCRPLRPFVLISTFPVRPSILKSQISDPSLNFFSPTPLVRSHGALVGPRGSNSVTVHAAPPPEQYALCCKIIIDTFHTLHSLRQHVLTGAEEALEMPDTRREDGRHPPSFPLSRFLSRHSS